MVKVIVGLGKTGLSCANYFARKGIPFAVNDTRAEPPGLAELKAKFPGITISLGALDKKLLASADEIILSPGISMHEPIIAECIANKIPVLGDIELFAREAKAPVCAITGSNGKSTVTTLVGEMARYSNLNVLVGGNLGTPALDLLHDKEPDLYVLELSSFQLETTNSLVTAAATILNISPDHMDRYATLNDYIAAKFRIYNGCKFIVWNRDDSVTQPNNSAQNTRAISFGLDQPKAGEFGLVKSDAGLYITFGDEHLISVTEIAIKGSHNWSNALAALSLGYALTFPLSSMLQALKTFGGLPHRCEWVGKHAGINWYNDSKGTNIGASISALKGIAAGILGKVVLIAGGQGKGADFSEFKQPVADYTRAVILIGEDADKIATAIEGASEIYNATNMQEAVKIAAKIAESGDAVLLSPACASFDMFQNFEHRGEVFTSCVKELS